MENEKGGNTYQFYQATGFKGQFAMLTLGNVPVYLHILVHIKKHLRAN